MMEPINHERTKNVVEQKNCLPQKALTLDEKSHKLQFIIANFILLLVIINYQTKQRQ